MPNNNPVLAALTISLSDCLTFVSFDLVQNNKLSNKEIECRHCCLVLYSVLNNLNGITCNK